MHRSGPPPVGDGHQSAPRLFTHGSILAVAALLAWTLLSDPAPAPVLRAGDGFTHLDPPRALPAFELASTQGGSLTPRAFEGRWTLVSIGFASCPDICPNTLSVLASAARSVPGTEVLFVSVDPERDTLERLAAYTRHFGDHVSGATGRHEALEEFVAPLGLFYEKGPGSDAHYGVEHSTTVLALAPTGEVAGLISGSDLRRDVVVTALHEFRSETP